MSLDLSFIIVNWNAREYLRKCIHSILESVNHLQFEIIVVDNGSADGSCEAIRAQFPNVKLIENNKNLGFARANNIGIKSSEGEYICFVNSDVIILDDAIKKMYNYLEVNQQIGLIGPKVLNSDHSIQKSIKKSQNIFTAIVRAFAIDKIFPFVFSYRASSIREVDVISGCFWMIKKTAIDIVGLLDERFFIYSEDDDFCKRIKDVGLKVVYYPEAEIIHFGGISSSAMPKLFFLELQKANYQFWLKHHNQISRFIYLCSVFINCVLRITSFYVLMILSPSKNQVYTLKIENYKNVLNWLLFSNKTILRQAQTLFVDSNES